MKLVKKVLNVKEESEQLQQNSKYRNQYHWSHEQIKETLSDLTSMNVVLFFPFSVSMPLNATSSTNNATEGNVTTPLDQMRPCEPQVE